MAKVTHVRNFVRDRQTNVLLTLATFPEMVDLAGDLKAASSLLKVPLVAGLQAEWRFQHQWSGQFRPVRSNL